MCYTVVQMLLQMWSLQLLIILVQQQDLNVCLMQLQEHHTPVRSGLFGGFVIGVIGVLLPPVMFWGEFEIGTLAAPSTALPHIWPKGGVWGLEPFQQNHYTPQLLLVIAVVKLITVSVTVNSGFRGGFIFPLFMAGTSLGLAITHITGMPFLQNLPDVVVAMTMAAGDHSLLNFQSPVPAVGDMCVLFFKIHDLHHQYACLFGIGICAMML